MRLTLTKQPRASMAAQPGVKAAQVQLAPAPRPREPVVLQELVLLAIAPALVAPEIALAAQKPAAGLAIEPAVAGAVEEAGALGLALAVVGAAQPRAARGAPAGAGPRRGG